MKKAKRYISKTSDKIVIQRGRDFREYKNITKSSRRRLGEILSHHNAKPCKTSYGTTIYLLWSV